jgi:hypothetical protein
MSKYEFMLDRGTCGLLTVIAVLLAIIAVELGLERPDIVPAAQAQIPDAGQQRYQAIAEAQRTNELLQEILDHLRTKAIKVEMRTDGADKPTKDRPQKR